MFPSHNDTNVLSVSTQKDNRLSYAQSEAWETRSLSLAAPIVSTVWAYLVQSTTAAAIADRTSRTVPPNTFTSTYIDKSIDRSICSGEVALKQIEHKEGTNDVPEHSVMQSAPRTWYHSWITGCSVCIYLLFRKISLRNLSKSVAFQQHKLYYDY